VTVCVCVGWRAIALRPQHPCFPNEIIDYLNHLKDSTTFYEHIKIKLSNKVTIKRHNMQ